MRSVGKHSTLGRKKEGKNEVESSRKVEEIIRGGQDSVMSYRTSCDDDNDKDDDKDKDKVLFTEAPVQLEGSP